MSGGLLSKKDDQELGQACGACATLEDDNRPDAAFVAALAGAEHVGAAEIIGGLCTRHRALLERLKRLAWGH